MCVLNVRLRLIGMSCQSWVATANSSETADANPRGGASRTWAGPGWGGLKELKHIIQILLVSDSSRVRGLIKGRTVARLHRERAADAVNGERSTRSLKKQDVNVVHQLRRATCFIGNAADQRRSSETSCFHSTFTASVYIQWRFKKKKFTHPC